MDIISYLDCKTVGFFFLKISKEIGKAWRKSAREPHTPVASHAAHVSPQSLCFQPRFFFDCSPVLQY